MNKNVVVLDKVWELQQFQITFDIVGLLRHDSFFWLGFWQLFCRLLERLGAQKTKRRFVSPTEQSVN